MAAGAAVTLARLTVRIGVGSSSFVKDMKHLEKTVIKFGETMGSVGRKMSTFITLPVLAAGAGALKMAVDVQESESMFGVAFGSMQKTAREWSERLRADLGLNSFEVRKSAATFYTMLTSMGLTTDEAYKMSTGLVELGADLSSFFNLKPEEAFEKLRAGILGEADGLKQLGILVDATSVKQLTMQSSLEGSAGVLARYEAILKQTGKAQGDLARTIDSPANQLRRLRNQFEEVAIRIGQALLPALQTILPLVQRFGVWIEGLMTSFSKLPERVQAGAIALGLLVLAAGPVLAALGAMIAGIAAIGASTLGVVVVVGALAAGLAAAWALGRDHFIAAWAAIRETLAAAWETMRPVFEQLQAVAVKAFQEIGRFAEEQFGKVLSWAREVWPTVQELVGKVARAIVALWNAGGADLLKELRANWILIRTTIGSTLDAILGVLKAALELMNGDFGKAGETLKETAKKVWDGVGRYFKAGGELALSAMWSLNAGVAEVVLGIMKRLEILAQTFLKLPLLDPGLRAAAGLALAGIREGIEGIQGVVENSQAKASEWAAAATATLSPLQLVKTGMDAIPPAATAAATGAMGGMISIVDARTGELATKLSGGFGRAADDFKGKFQAGWKQVSDEIANTKLQAQVTPVVDRAAFVRALKELGLQPATAGLVP